MVNKTGYVWAVLFLLLFFAGSCMAIEAEDLKSMMDQGKKVTLIDTRAATLYTLNHIPGAINIPSSVCGYKSLPPLANVILYGDGIDRSGVLNCAEFMLRKNGIDADILSGGLGRWAALKYPLTGNMGMTRRDYNMITYQELEKAVRDNPDLIFVDLRKKKSRSVMKSGISRQFRNVRQIRPERADAADLFSAVPNDGKKLMVIIDSNDGAAGKLAQRLSAARGYRFVILAGGEEALRSKGVSGKSRKIGKILK